MSRNFDLYLDDIITACSRIQRYTRRLTLAKIKKDDKTLDAVVRNLEVIGEAVKHVPASFRNQHSHIEWKKIAGLRDILIHEYFGIDVDIVWDVVRNHLPHLLADIQQIRKAPKP